VLFELLFISYCKLGLKEYLQHIYLKQRLYLYIFFYIQIAFIKACGMSVAFDIKVDSSKKLNDLDFKKCCGPK